MKSLEKYIDHTALKPTVGVADIQKLCREAREHGFYAVCVNSRFVPLSKKELDGSDVKIASVIGFPLGAMATEAKVFETEYACKEGASEIDMVLEVGLLKEGHKQDVLSDIEAVVNAAKKYGAIVKVILETGLLSDGEIVDACKLSEQAGAAFVKTCTGFGTGSAEARHVELMRSTVGPGVSVKASGGIRDRETAELMIKAGADRIGASAGVSICGEPSKQPIVDEPSTEEDECMGKRIVILTGSPREGGNTQGLVDAFIQGAKEAGNTVTTFNVAAMNISPCKDCGYCGKHDGLCVQQDDMAKIIPHMYTDDIIVFATPVYFYGMTAQIKTAIDRLICLRPDSCTIKACALLVPYGDTDTTVVVPTMDMYKAFTGYLNWHNLGIVSAEGAYGLGDIEGHKAVKEAYTLGKSIK